MWPQYNMLSRLFQGSAENFFNFYPNFDTLSKFLPHPLGKGGKKHRNSTCGERIFLQIEVFFPVLRGKIVLYTDTFSK